MIENVIKPEENTMWLWWASTKWASIETILSEDKTR